MSVHHRASVIAAAFAFLLCAAPATAQVGGNRISSGGAAVLYGFSDVSGSLTRANDTTTYSSNVLVASSKSTTSSPTAIQIGTSTSSTGTITSLKLLKNGSTTANATFVVWLYSGSPKATVKDNGVYIGPFASDIPLYLGNATCVTPNSTNDGTVQIYFDCALSNPNSGATLPFVTSNGSVYAMIEVTAAYSPAANEVFTVFLGGYRD